MYIFEVLLFLFGIGFLFFGFLKNNRNILASAAIMLFFTGILGQSFSGFLETISK
jgi:hypothetical protein